jgi:hypothetical protein
MTTSSVKLIFNFIRCLPFIGVVCAITMMIRALVKGSLIYHAGWSPIRRDVNPIWFWLYIGGHLALAIFLVLLGLAFFNLAPNWFIQMMGELHKK